MASTQQLPGLLLVKPMLELKVPLRWKLGGLVGKHQEAKSGGKAEGEM